MKLISEQALTGNYNVTSPPDYVEIGVLGKRANKIDYTANFNKIRHEEASLLSSITGLPIERIIFLDQEHGTEILTVTSLPKKFNKTVGKADGAITNLQELCLIIRTADCVPLFITDTDKGVIAAIHSGWRSTAENISGQAVDRMIKEYNCSTSNMRAFILPSIGPESYEVGKEVADHFPDDIDKAGDSLYLNLWSSIKRSLIHHGIQHDKIQNAETCTLKRKDIFFSHRGGDQGRNLNYILMR